MSRSVKSGAAVVCRSCQTLGVMQPADIDQLVDSSLSGTRSVYTGHVPDSSALLTELESAFRLHRIPPELQIVILEREVVEPHLIPGPRTVYFVCRSDPHSVFFDPETQSFGCAWGPELPDLKYIDLGFRSKDVLEMLSA
jgi:hypothetical protein